MRCALAAARVTVVQAVHVGKQDQRPGPGDVRDQGRQPVVVAEPDLVGGHRVVLVDHGTTPSRAAGPGCAGRCGSGCGASGRRRSAGPGRCGCRAVEGHGVARDQQALADAGRRLLGRQVARTPGPAERDEAGGDGPGGDQDGAGCRRAPGGRAAASAPIPSTGDPAVRSGQRGGADLDHRPGAAGRCRGAGRAGRCGLRWSPRSASSRGGACGAAHAPGAWPVRAAGHGSRAPSRTPPRRPARRSGPRPPGSAPAAASASSTPEPGQPVGQVADRLVVAEVGLPHPAHRLLAPDQEALVRGPDHLEAGSSAGSRPSTTRAASGSGRPHGRPVRDERAHREAELAQALVGRGGDLEDLVAARLAGRASPGRPARGRPARRSC